MVNRIYNKFIQLLDKGVILVYNGLESLGIAKPIPYQIEKAKGDLINVQHPFPVNVIESDKPLFNEWKTYPTFENKLFVLHNCNVSYKGIVFKGPRCFVPALPHPVFKGQYGPLFCWKQQLFYKRTVLDPSKTYYLVTDHWAYANYFHWMVDSMCRLIEWKNELKDFTLLMHKEAPRYIIDTLKYLGVARIEWIQPDHYVSVPNLIIPNYCAWSGQQHPFVLKKVRDFIWSNVEEENGSERIYVSRRNQKVRRVANEDALIDVLLENKFEILYFEGMSVAQQVSLVKNARYFISSHGANMTNGMFVLNGRILELLREDRPNFCYWATFSCLNMSYSYQLCRVVNHDDLLVDIEQFKINLHKLLND